METNGSTIKIPETLPLTPTSDPVVATITLSLASPLRRMTMSGLTPEDHNSILDQHNAGRLDILAHLVGPNIDSTILVAGDCPLDRQTAHLGLAIGRMLPFMIKLWEAAQPPRPPRPAA